MSTRRHSRRGSSRQAAEESQAPSQAQGTRRSSRRAPAQADDDSQSRSSSRRAQAQSGASSRRSRNESSAGSRRGGSSGGSSREDKVAARKKKSLIQGIAIVAGIIVLGLIGWSMMPNPNLPKAESDLNKAKAMMVQFEEAMDSKSTASASSLAGQIKELLAVPLFANGTNDQTLYTDPAFSDIYYATEAKNIMDELNEALTTISDIDSELSAKRNKDRIISRINNIKNEESIEVVQAMIADFRRNPVDLSGDPDLQASAKYSRFIEAVNARVKDVVAEDERRKKLSEEQRKAEEAERARLEAERKAKAAAEREATIAAAREKANSEREAMNKPPEEKDVPKGKDFSKMSNAQIAKEANVLAKELKFNAAKAVMKKMKEEEGYDLAGEQAKLNEDMLILFNNARQEMMESFNDARQLERANMVADARKSIDSACKKIDLLLDNCIDPEAEKELKELKPHFDRIFNKLNN